MSGVGVPSTSFYVPAEHISSDVQIFNLDNSPITFNNINPTTAGNRLFNILLSINLSKAASYFDRCVSCNVDESQLLKLTEYQMSLMFPVDQIGFLADFAQDILKWQASMKQIPNVDMAGLYGTNNSAPKNNTLLSIISNNRSLTSKALLNLPDGELKTLNSKERIVMLDLIRDHFVNFCNNKMSYDAMDQIADEICHHFNGEKKILYFNRSIKILKNKERMRASGKLVDKWNNRHEKPKKVVKSAEELYFTSRISVSSFSGELSIEDQEKIRINFVAKQSTPISIMINDWKRCNELRFKCIEENRKKPGVVFTEWPYYKHKEGFILVSGFY